MVLGHFDRRAQNGARSEDTSEATDDINLFECSETESNGRTPPTVVLLPERKDRSEPQSHAYSHVAFGISTRKEDFDVRFR